jgi:hypothetical protein
MGFGTVRHLDRVTRSLPKGITAALSTGPQELFPEHIEVELRLLIPDIPDGHRLQFSCGQAGESSRSAIHNLDFGCIVAHDYRFHTVIDSRDE